MKGWIGIVRVHEAADRACKIFFPSAVLEVYTKMQEHIRSNYVGTPVVVPGGPDKKKDWETFIEEVPKNSSESGRARLVHTSPDCVSGTNTSFV